MSDKAIWLIYHRASIGEGSSLNMDGSTLSYGIAAVPEQNLEKALSLLKEDLKKDRVTLLEVYKCHRADVTEMPGEADLHDDIGYAIRTAESRGVVSLIAIGDEALD
jgi:hypothetical protein